ncbi:unnamed protein product [Sphagnum jensenii]|uniref:BAG-associated GRAM protein 1 n=1 Tax=Sphagnum jensenii TaxID=128206 RepID=A0ABP1BQ55_9BRYO
MVPSLMMYFRARALFIVANKALEVLVPTWGEINVSLTAAVALVILVSLLQHASAAGKETARPAEKQKGMHLPAVSELETVLNRSTVQEGNKAISLELLAAKNLISANLNGTSDPYAIITCGLQKRFSSMVPGSRNPMWGEEFDFYTEELPVQVKIAIYDWDIVWKSACLGSTTLDIGTEGQTEAVWHVLDSPSGQVCIQLMTKRYPVSASGTLNGYPGLITHRRLLLENPVGTEVRQKPGPLQTIFELPPDEVVLHSFSCALERSFLYHGRVYLSAWNICFHSNVFAKQMKVILPYENIEEIKRSQHAIINPAITITLRSGSGGQGVPPLVRSDGRAKYKFASFWNRNHAHRALQRAHKNFATMQAVAKQEQQVSSMRTRSGSSRTFDEAAVKIDTSEPSEVPIVIQPFLQEDVLNNVVNVELPCTAEEYFSLCLGDDSKLMQSYCDHQKSTKLQMEQWKDSEQYGGQTREVTYRSICKSPMCPPDTAVTVWQHAAFSSDKQVLIFEAVSQIHDVPFGSYFEVHAKWTFSTKSAASCILDIRVGAHFKKWCLMQSKIKAGTVLEMKGDAELMIELARKEIVNSKLTSQQEDEAFTANLEGNGDSIKSGTVAEPAASELRS